VSGAASVERKLFGREAHGILSNRPQYVCVDLYTLLKPCHEIFDRLAKDCVKVPLQVFPHKKKSIVVRPGAQDGHANGLPLPNYLDEYVVFIHG